MKKHFTFSVGKILALSTLIVLSFASCSKEPAADTSFQESPINDVATVTSGRGSLQSVPNEILVKFRSTATASQRADALARVGGQVQERIVTKAMLRAGDSEGLTLIHTSMEAFEAAGRIKNADIVFAEPNYIFTKDAASSDPYYTSGDLWGMKGDFGCNAENAWAEEKTGSAGVFVGVIDEGIQFEHPDLAGQVWTNPYDLADGIDNDGNGYVDDIHGWDFDGNNNTIYDGGIKGTVDDHGTHVSGTIGAKANNGTGVVGVNWNITIVAAKFLGRRGGSLANAVKAVDYLTDLKKRHNINLVASNNSWGGGGFSQALLDAITRANTFNILFIAAAGNGGSDGVGDNNDNTPSYPSSYDVANVIAVASITKLGAKSSFSNFGLKSVDLGAPGSGIWSTTAFNLYESYSGTSMATPHVTGAAALYKSLNPLASASIIKSAILDNAVPISSLTGKCVTGGRLDLTNF